MDKWFISDTHFFHTNMLKFVDDQGHRVRKEFPHPDEDHLALYKMHETIIKNWNDRVMPKDYVYHLGDVTFQYHGLFNNLMSRLNGQKRLIVGNHDKLKNPNLMKWFDKVMLWHGFKEENFTAIHIPIPLNSLRDGMFCVHGHTHQYNLPDEHYINMCVEVRDYCPVSMGELIEEIKQRMS